MAPNTKRARGACSTTQYAGRNTSKSSPMYAPHVTDAGEGRVIILLHGWPLSDEMYEYQYTDLVECGFRVLGITLKK